ncbi:tRNA (N6-threonylcarbamoyladenosine(37)-N6)-methyltransferase TrmO [Candidatus Bipolaricaulota bacterium]|nr:tRNA (N6-threonylcarbamoyladenosine(37)-N6)-methyltransferase TrmO [Candidatus Bipolaricaulota bacterium]
MDSWNEPISYRPIGVIHTPHTDSAKTPIQPRYARGIKGTIEIDPAYEQGLSDLEGFSHILLLFHLHRAKSPHLMVIPFLGDHPRGVFATRSPTRPNPIGLSVVRLIRREGRTLHISDVDILDGTPLLDIKPYIERFDVEGPVRNGWQAAIDDEEAQRRGSRRDPYS